MTLEEKLVIPFVADEPTIQKAGKFFLLLNRDRLAGLNGPLPPEKGSSAYYELYFQTLVAKYLGKKMKAEHPEALSVDGDTGIDETNHLLERFVDEDFGDKELTERLSEMHPVEKLGIDDYTLGKILCLFANYQKLSPVRALAKVIVRGGQIYQGSNYSYALGTFKQDLDYFDFWLNKLPEDLGNYAQTASEPVTIDQVDSPARSTLLKIVEMCVGRYKQKTVTLGLKHSVSEVLSGINNDVSEIIDYLIGELLDHRQSETESRVIIDLNKRISESASQGICTIVADINCHNFTLDEYIKDIKNE